MFTGESVSSSDFLKVLEFLHFLFLLNGFQNAAFPVLIQNQEISNVLILGVPTEACFFLDNF